MSDVPVDGADAPGTSTDGSRLVHVDCERCRSRLEVRVPLAFQLAGREATVRCGACETLLQVSVAPPLEEYVPSPRPATPASPADSHAAAAAFLQQHPVEDDTSQRTHSYRTPSDSATPCRAHDEQRTHIQLAQWHMNMAQRHTPPIGSLETDSFIQYAPPFSRVEHARGGAGPSQDHVEQLLRRAAHDFWSNEKSGDRFHGDRFHNPQSGRVAKVPKRERKPREPSSYNVFIRDEIPKLKRSDPSLNHRDAFKLAARNWATSPLNARSASYEPTLRPTLCPTLGGDANRDRDAIMAKLHPHLVRCREEDAAGTSSGETDGEGAKAELGELDAADTKAKARGTETNSDAVDAAKEAVECVVASALDALTKGYHYDTPVVSSDKSTADTDAWYRAPARSSVDHA